MEYVSSRLDLKLVLVVWKAFNQVSPLLALLSVHSESLVLGWVQQSLLAPMGAIPSGNRCSSLLTFVVLITIELVTKVCIVDFNVYITLSPKAFFSWVIGPNLRKQVLCEWIK